MAPEIGRSNRPPGTIFKMHTPEQHRVYQLNRYHQRRAFAIEFLGGKCVICGSVNDLEIDHIDPSKKDFSISRYWDINEILFIIELYKCQLLCKEHHKQKHSKRIHGTYTMYKNGKCRCVECKKANAIYMYNYRARYGRDRFKIN